MIPRVRPSSRWPSWALAILVSFNVLGAVYYYYVTWAPVVMTSSGVRLVRTAGSRVYVEGDKSHVMETEEDLGMSTSFHFTSSVSHQSPRQLIEIFTSPVHGSLLFLDHSLQLSTREAAHYHEVLVHVPMAYQARRQRVLIIGGGDGATLREVLKYRSVEQVVQVEWDEAVVRMSQQHLPQLATGFQDPRTQLVIQDARQYLIAALAELHKSPSTFVPFDLLILDTTDLLHHANAISDWARLLHADGTLVAEVNTGSVLRASSLFHDVAPLRNAFTHVRLYRSQAAVWVPGEIVFVMCSQTKDPLQTPINWPTWLNLGLSLSYYNPGVHIAALSLPNEFLVAGGLALSDCIPSPSVWDSLSRVDDNAWRRFETGIKAAVGAIQSKPRGVTGATDVLSSQSASSPALNTIAQLTCPSCPSCPSCLSCKVDRPGHQRTKDATQETGLSETSTTVIPSLVPSDPFERLPSNSSAARLQTIAPMLVSALSARLRTAKSKVSATRHFKRRCAEQMMQTLCRSGSLGVSPPIPYVTEDHDRHQRSGDGSVPSPQSSSEPACAMMPFYVSSELASPSDAPPPSSASHSRARHHRSFLHVSCNCTLPLASESDGVLVLHPDCVGGVDIGVLFDAQECTLWEFTAVYESLLARRNLAVDVSGDWVRLGERGRLPWDLCEGLSPGFPSTGLQDVYNHIHHIPHADSEPPLDGVGRPSKRTMADVLLGLPAVRLTPPVSPMPARFAAHSFPHPLLGGRCGVCQGRGYILPELAHSGSSSVEHLLLQQHTQQQRQLKKRLVEATPTPTAASLAPTAVTDPPVSATTDATSSEFVGRRLTQAVEDASAQLSANQQFSWISTNADKSLLQQFMAVAETRPSNSFSGSDGAKFDQGSIDYRDVLHRALFVDERGDLSDKNLLIVGDDDLFSIVAALTGEPRMIVVLEKDPRLVDFINNVSVTHSWNDWLVAFQYDVANALDDSLLAGRPMWFDSRGFTSFRRAFDVFICDPPDTIESYALWLSRATEALRGPSSTMYISTTHIEAGAPKWQVFQRMMIFAGFIISDLRRQFTRYPTSDDDLRELTTIPRLTSVKALRSSELSWYSSSFVRLVMVDADPRPLLTGDWQVGELMYTDQDQFPTFNAHTLSALWAQQLNDLAVHGLLRPPAASQTLSPTSSSASASASPLPATDPPDL